MTEFATSPRIISVSRRTDIPAFYSDWFRHRLDTGWCEAANAYSRRAVRVSLKRQDVLAWVFWSRDYGRFLKTLEDLHASEQHFLCHFTITGFPRLLEPRTIDADRAVEQAHRIAERFGRRIVQWRYDPVLLSALTPPEWHLDNFRRLAESLRGAGERCIFSFLQMYRKTIRNLALAAMAGSKRLRVWVPGEHNPERDQFSREDLTALVEGLFGIAAENGFELQNCCGPDWIVRDTSATPASCIDWPLLCELGVEEHLPSTSAIQAPQAQADLFQDMEPFAPRQAPVIRRQPSRKGCGCWSSIDIGAYETCTHGCAYCYAVDNTQAALERVARQDPEAARLGD